MVDWNANHSTQFHEFAKYFLLNCIRLKRINDLFDAPWTFKTEKLLFINIDTVTDGG